MITLIPKINVTVKCPRCGEEATPLGTHYICQNPICRIKESEDDEIGVPVQFKFIADKQVRFPYNIIFKNRDRTKFYRVPYLEITSPGVTSLDRPTVSSGE